MKLATIRTHEGIRAVRVEGDDLIDLGRPDVGSLLVGGNWKQAAAIDGKNLGKAMDADYAPVVPEPGNTFCVGLNYRNHILEMGRELPEFPTIFSKVSEALIGAGDDIVRPKETEAFDWECELAVIIGSPVRRATEQEAEAAIAGFAVLNDVTTRDWQYRSKQWLQGKNWEDTTPVGPYLVTPDELDGDVRPALSIRTVLDGETMQEDSTGDLLFNPVELVQYLSTFVTLKPGDIIATGTPGGVGHARDPKRYMNNGQALVTEIEGVGRLENAVVDDEDN